ncbi:MAG TPA: SET domain-containing protein-lysine N-methyltransferase [Cryomorphaceae bacterium]|nr:SET domain-containing protein-lysine N-methyltransferase [Owenweeksia sp.]MBF99504.1 SET domain-containing protein-lysine N-methyltransferase [Owenweeksia sp.]HAD96757.1 SET domain-containing protein-lysine N-methyltransferase [Cryomorphaceae bacterium]HBF18526.1 SET domain-containing protein-lysine N-methyltransferase [Cryomorphaceae bacterium]HCQ14715.1 SET domain-containing protein-lysine N-methyltransferase [Cryomorphaceae bacterium]|tara:strand:+ start:1016 stop:1609 length:594 start_codon:yes stop_codon:yes gene_type:complete
MIHPDTEIRFISNEIGYGVVAKKLIPKGTITWVLDKLDREFTPLEVSDLDPVYREILGIYTFRNNKGNYVLCWDNGRYVNHSFNSNCLTTAYDFEIAIRDIQVGEQLTDDYGYLNINEPFRAHPEGTRRKIVYPDDLLKYYKNWDKKLLPAFKRIPEAEQPLRNLIKAEQWEEIEKIASGEKEMVSILSNYYSEDQD